MVAVRRTVAGGGPAGVRPGPLNVAPADGSGEPLRVGRRAGGGRYPGTGRSSRISELEGKPSRAATTSRASSTLPEGAAI